MLHGQTRYGLPSRFLEEIPERLKTWLTSRVSARPAYVPSVPGKDKTLFARPRDGAGFRIGQNVLHPKFGAGVIVDAEGRGAEARVQVNFGRQGVKWLAVAVAKLEAA